MKESITISEMGTFLRCPRLYYLRYIKLWSPEKLADALYFGTAWHAAMEARNNGATYENALRRALSLKGNEVDDVLAARLSGLLAGYYVRYGERGADGLTLNSEVPFDISITGTRKFSAAGKIDGLGTAADGVYVLHEYKTTGENITDDDFWLRTRYNIQLYQYVEAARRFGWNVGRVIYDVTRKPTIRPRERVATLDANGLKQVIDASGNRVIKRDGTYRQTAVSDKGETVVYHAETMEEYAQRVLDDTLANPEESFQRREVPVLDDGLADFIRMRLTFVKNLLFLRALSKKCRRAEDAYSRNCTSINCKWCEMRWPCLELRECDDVPAGFRVKAIKHEELVAEVAE